MKKKKIRLAMQIITVIMTFLIILFVIYGFKENIFGSDDGLIHFIENCGIIAPIVFIFIQIIQVILPVIPGGASCLAGVIAFGGFYGFLYNYIGLCIGSICSFFLAKIYGNKLIEFLFKRDTIDKYLGYVKSKKFEKIFIWGIILPGAPDDLLCYMAGFSKMNFWTFLYTILLAKPLTLVFYSLFQSYFPLFN